MKKTGIKGRRNGCTGKNAEAGSGQLSSGKTLLRVKKTGVKMKGSVRSIGMYRVSQGKMRMPPARQRLAEQKSGCEKGGENPVFR